MASISPRNPGPRPPTTWTVMAGVGRPGSMPAGRRRNPHPAPDRPPRRWDQRDVRQACPSLSRTVARLRSGPAISSRHHASSSGVEVRRQPPVGQRQGALAAALLRPWPAGQAHPAVRRLGHHDASVVEQDAASGTSPDTNGSDIGNCPGMLIPPIPVQRLMIKAPSGVAAPRRGPACVKGKGHAGPSEDRHRTESDPPQPTTTNDNHAGQIGGCGGGRRSARRTHENWS